MLPREVLVENRVSFTDAQHVAFSMYLELLEDAVGHVFFEQIGELIKQEQQADIKQSVDEVVNSVALSHVGDIIKQHLYDNLIVLGKNISEEQVNLHKS